MKTYTIWNCDDGYSQELRKELQEWSPELSEVEILEKAIEINNGYLEDERINLNIELDNELIAIATLDLWDGDVMSYKVIENNNISNCLYSSYYAHWYVDSRGNFRALEFHHDGVNKILYREFRDEITDAQKENFKAKIVKGKITKNDINRYTRRVGDKIAQIYGWEVTKSREAK